MENTAVVAKQSVTPSGSGSRGAITKVSDRRSCPACGAELGETAKFCPKCGSPVPEKAKAPQKRFCAECGAELPEGAKFCENCGTAAAGVTIPVTGKVNSVTVSDKSPKRSGTPRSGAKGSADALRRIIAQLADSDISASAASGEMRLPVTEAQNEFLKLIGKGM